MSNGPTMWDERFRDGARPYGTEPSHHLRENVSRIRPGGRVLAPGDGGGRNGVWLARQGFEVEIWDYSPEGLTGARRWADESGVAVKTHLVDVIHHEWPVTTYDAVISVYLHLPPSDRSRVHQAMIRSLKPGGLLLIEGFHVDQMAFSSGGPRDPALLFTEDAVREDLATLDNLQVRRDQVLLNESLLHAGPAVLLRASGKQTGFH